MIVKLKWLLTSAGQEHLDSDILQQVPPGEDGADLAEVPFAVQVLAVLQNLERQNWLILG